MSEKVFRNEPERWAGARSSRTHPHGKEGFEMSRATGKSSKKTHPVRRGLVFQDGKWFGAGQAAGGRPVRRLSS